MSVTYVNRVRWDPEYAEFVARMEDAPLETAELLVKKWCFKFVGESGAG